VDFSLERLSDKVARALLRLGVVPGDRVGILAPKSAAAVVGVYGALKAGARYVPLDPKVPRGAARPCRAGLRRCRDRGGRGKSVAGGRSDRRGCTAARCGGCGCSRRPGARGGGRCPRLRRGHCQGPARWASLYVRGPSLMRGYWGQSARTNEALVRTSTGKVD
jgi:acyl-CoA synthetase (AMP-forming)/AMP-acid ligase II